MTVQALYTAATGMQAMETKLDVIANNLANINTTGFKKGRANFEDLFYRHYVQPGLGQSSQRTATGTSVGLGTRVSSIQTDFKQGAMQLTGNPLDIAIEGAGFFQVQDIDGGTFLYTRTGNFSVNAEGTLVLGSATAGRVVQPPITIPPDAISASVQYDGTVLVTQPGQTTQNSVGQIQIATFVNPEGLEKMGENLFKESDASGANQLGNPGEQGRGKLRSGVLEASNVEPVQELIDLITTQRSFELNSQAVQAGDQVMSLVANLRRG
ncbi:MAG: flagellar basal-body rod protein FlgG [Pirellulaceae bacterium]